MRILAIINGDYGKRHIDNVCAHAPATWSIEIWEGPQFLPLVIDYPEDYLPDAFHPADLLLAFHELKGIAELLPDIAQMCQAKACIAAVDNEAWLPRGLARQLRGWMADIQVSCVTPKPLCSLTEHSYTLGRRTIQEYEDAYIAEFARYFGRPSLQLDVDPHSLLIVAAQVERDAVCGCARYVAENLVGVSADDAEQKAGLLHHHYPCLASMGIDADFGDTLMHVSGNVLKDNVAEQVAPYRQTSYITPGNRSEGDS